MTKNGGPAFPSIETDVEEHEPGGFQPHVYSFGGMTLRDWFAGIIISGLIVSKSTEALVVSALKECGEDYKLSTEIVNRVLAEEAFHLADAMLKERAK